MSEIAVKPKPAYVPATRSAPTSIADYERLAREKLPPDAWEYLSRGAGSDITVRANVAAFQDIHLMSGVLTDLAGANTALRLFDEPLVHPILLAPTAAHRQFHGQGEVATARGAASATATLTVSNNSSLPIEDIARSAGGARLWCQVYLQEDRAASLDHVRRAEAAGCQAVVVTVDTVQLPKGVSLQIADSPLFGRPLAHPTWKDIDWLRGITKLPLLVKGIMDPHDAQRAVAHGVSGIVVSNHGGRALDTLPPTVAALPRIVASIACRLPVLMDGGIRSGADVFKALALGATAVMIGRPYLFGLAVAGAAGVAHVVRLLRGDLEMTMALTGRPTLQAIDRSALWTA